MKEINYEHWAKYIVEIASDHIKNEHPAVLELASGNCKMAGFLSQRYPNLIASDKSLLMLKWDYKNNLSKICCDMTAIQFKAKFDLIISTFDSMNYLLNKRKLLTLFKEVKRVLKSNGVFTFDVSLENNSLEFDKSNLAEGTVNGYTFTRKSKYYPKLRIHKNVFEIMDKFGKVIREVHKQKIYKFETYFDLIDKAGLYAVECLDAFTFNNGSANSDRVQFILMIDRNKC